MTVLAKLLAFSLTLTAGAAVAALPPFALLERDAFVDRALKAPGRSGAQILRSMCFRPPPHCMPGSSACSHAPEYPAVEAFYQIRVERIASRAARPQRYRVLSVAVASLPGLRYRPLKAGRILRWSALPAGSQERRLVTKYLIAREGIRAARHRLAALDFFVQETQWHEQQHARHFTEYLAAYERIVNDPRGFPTTVRAGNAAYAKNRVELAIAKDRDRRLQRLANRLDACVREFHQREMAAGTFSTRVGECACYGGDACDSALPPFPTEFRCNFDVG